MQNPADIDVLVVGAGPTGLMLANQLARHDVRLRIVDRNHGPSIRTKALGVQARTLEIYDRLGIAERAIELGTRATGANLWCKGRPAARVSLGDGRDLTPYPFLLILGQDDNERLLGDALHDRGMDVTWDTELVGLTQGPGHAVATLRRGDGSLSEVRANWVAGCDGAHSAVRRLCGIAFAGSPYEQVFFIADTRATGTMVPGELNAYLRRDGFHLFFPMRGKDRWRVVGIVPPDLRAREDLDFDAVLPSIRKEVGPHLSLPECHWFSTYRIHHRRAERFRDRRCFLLGDAAHIHSPVGAQGMNTGLQDAYNLAWKLALVASGLARDTLLDSYESERIPVAERLLRTTDQAFSLFVSDRWGAGLLRARFLPGVLALAMKRERIRKRAFRTISQIGIRYAGGPLSDPRTDLPDGAPRAGDRFPWLRLKLAPDSPAEDLFARLDDTRFQLILFGQPFVPGNSSDHEGMVLIHRVPDDPVNDQECARARIPRPSFYLLRPDGHVGVAGKIVESATLARYLVERIQYRAEWDRPLPRRRAA